MTFEQKAILYYQYCLDLETDGYGGVAFTPTEFFQNLEEESIPNLCPNEDFNWDLLDA